MTFLPSEAFLPSVAFINHRSRGEGGGERGGEEGGEGGGERGSAGGTDYLTLRSFSVEGIDFLLIAPVGQASATSTAIFFSPSLNGSLKGIPTTTSNPLPINVIP